MMASLFSAQSLPTCAIPPAPEVAEHISVSGRVQGVGLRPTVYRIATELGLRGTVGRSAEGVTIMVAGSPVGLMLLVARLLEECPPLGKISCIKRCPVSPRMVSQQGFCIVPGERLCRV